MEVYSVEEDDLRRISDSDLEYEENLEEHLLKSRGAEIGGVKLFYVSRQESPDEGGIFDILGVDEDGDIVVVELKRGKAPRTAVAQALEYASGIRNESYDVLNERYERFLRHLGRDVGEDVSLRDDHAEFFAREDDPLSEREFNTRQRLVVVGTEFRDVTLNMADILRDHGMDVVCVGYKTFKSEDEEIELLTTESVRRPLDEEPGGGERPDSLTDTERAQKEFWRGLAEKINHRSDTPLYADSVKPRNWFAQRRNLTSSVHYSFIVNTHQGYLQVKLHIKDDVDQIYEYLENRRTEIESEIGGELQWNPSPGEGRKATIILQRDGNIKTNRDRWDAYQNWLIEYGEAFDQVFGFHLQDFAE